MYLRGPFCSGSKECVQEHKMEEGRPVMRFFGLFGNSVSSGEPRTFAFGTFFVFPKAQCCASTNLLCGYVQISSLLFLFAFSFFSLCPLSVGKVIWEGGQCWQGDNRNMFIMVYDPRASKRRNVHIWASSLGLLSISEIFKDISSKGNTSLWLPFLQNH